MSAMTRNTYNAKATVMPAKQHTTNFSMFYTYSALPDNSKLLSVTFPLLQVI